MLGFHFYPSDREVLGYLLDWVTGRSTLGDNFITTDNLYGTKEPSEIFGHDHAETRRYFYTKLTKKTAGGRRFSRDVGKGTWLNKGQATPILSSDKRVIVGYRRTFRYQRKTKADYSDQDSWLMTEYVLPNPAIKSDGIKETFKNYALCVLKKRSRNQELGDQNTPPCSGLAVDFGDVGCSSSCLVEDTVTDCRPGMSPGVVLPLGDDLDLGEADEDWTRELEESLMDHGDVAEGAPDCVHRQESGASPLVDDVVLQEAAGPQEQTELEDWICELEQNMMDHCDEAEGADDCVLLEESGSSPVVGAPLVDDVVFKVGQQERSELEDWICELKESIMDHRDDAEGAADCVHREESGSSPVARAPLVGDVVFKEAGRQERSELEDWICELEESIMDHNDCKDNPAGESGTLVEKADEDFQRQLMDFFDFEIPEDEQFTCGNLPDDGRFFWKDYACDASNIPRMAAAI